MVTTEMNSICEFVLWLILVVHLLYVVVCSIDKISAYFIIM